MKAPNNYAAEAAESPSPEIPSWHQELPLQWPQITFTKPDSVQKYSLRGQSNAALEKLEALWPRSPKRKGRRARKITHGRKIGFTR